MQNIQQNEEEKEKNRRQKMNTCPKTVGLFWWSLNVLSVKKNTTRKNRKRKKQEKKVERGRRKLKKNKIIKTLQI